MAQHRSHSIEFKRQVAQEFIAGETLHALAKRYDISRTLIRISVTKFEARVFDENAQAADLLEEYEAKIIARIDAICEELEVYGYRGVGAELRHQGIVVNSKKIRRLMREHDLQQKRRRRHVATTHSYHDAPIFPNSAPDAVVKGPNQLWVADITYIAISTKLIAVKPAMQGIRDGLVEAISEVHDLDRRLARANINWPTDRNSSFPAKTIKRMMDFLGSPVAQCALETVMACATSAEPTELTAIAREC